MFVGPTKSQLICSWGVFVYFIPPLPDYPEECDCVKLKFGPNVQ